MTVTWALPELVFRSPWKVHVVSKSGITGKLIVQPVPACRDNAEIRSEAKSVSAKTGLALQDSYLFSSQNTYFLSVWTATFPPFYLYVILVCCL